MATQSIDLVGSTVSAAEYDQAAPERVAEAAPESEVDDEVGRRADDDEKVEDVLEVADDVRTGRTVDVVLVQGVLQDLERRVKESLS